MTISDIGKVASLHLHPAVAGEPLLSVSEIHAEAGKGIVGNNRKYNKKDRHGQPSKRQITLIAREQIAEHAAALGLPEIAPGDVRSNIETAGIDLISLIGQKVKVGEAVLLFCEARTPCPKMDRVAPGLQKIMGNSRQGVLAQVISPGAIRVGDKITATA